MEVTWVNRQDAEKIWPSVEPYLVSALKRWLPVYFPCDLLDMVKKDEAQLWIVTNNKEKKLYGAALSQIIPYPRARVLNLFLLGGKDWKKWKDDWSGAIKVFARSQNCEIIQAIGRRGWSAMPEAFESAVITNLILD